MGRKFGRSTMSTTIDKRVLYMDNGGEIFILAEYIFKGYKVNFIHPSPP